MINLEQLKIKYLDLINQSSCLDVLEEVRVRALGKNGEISNLARQLGKMPVENRRKYGQQINIVKQELLYSIENWRKELQDKSVQEKIMSETLDMTLPVFNNYKGAIHPLTQAEYELTTILLSMGFSIAEGPDIENEFYNFSALNIGDAHPARQEQDTFYIKKNFPSEEACLLRTHTSPVQIRIMQQSSMPIKIIAPGRVYRSDYDATHTPTFQQIEGLFIDKKLHMGHLKSYITALCQAFFEMPELKIRFRPSYFPFTEPSAEVDIACGKKNGELVIGLEDDWLEVLGCGMVHPNVLENCNIDPEEYQGFAFGIGIERMAMLKYNIPDLRSFYENDPRWIKYYGFSPFAAFTGG